MEMIIVIVVIWAAIRFWPGSPRKKETRQRISPIPQKEEDLEQFPELEHLNAAQRRAVVNFGDRVFVSAGAGSGKTRVITEKARHAVRQGVARPNEIAVITFTNKATDEVRERLQDLPGVTVDTIHRLAMRVIEELGGSRPQISPLATDDRRRQKLLSQWLEELLAEQPKFLFEVFVRNQAFQRFAAVTPDKALPLVPPDNTPVRSLGEARIALILQACGTRYFYEKKIIVPTTGPRPRHRSWHPDFFIPDDPTAPDPTLWEGVWLEHYAHDRNGRLPPEFNDYDKKRDWKRKAAAGLKLRYTETCYGDIQRAQAGGQNFGALLVARINEHRSEPLTVPRPEEVEKALAHLIRQDRAGAIRISSEIDAWIKAWRQRARNHPSARRMGIQQPDVGAATDALEHLARPLMARWEQWLRNQGTDDFEGVILRATDLLRKNTGPIPWKVVFLDEAQDINPAQADFVEALTGSMRPGDPRRKARLTAVGDAWQAIFGFQGGSPDFLDLGGTRNDPLYDISSRVDLDRTYRHGDSIAQTARAYVLRNTSARERKVTGDPKGFHDPRWPGAVSIASCRLTPRGETSLGGSEKTRNLSGSTAALFCVLRRISESRHRAGDREMGHVLILARNNANLVDLAKSPEKRTRDLLQQWSENPASMPPYAWDMSQAELRREARRIADKQEGFCHALVAKSAERLRLKTEPSTVHAAKGREADYVIVLDAGPGTATEQASVRALEEALVSVRGAPVWIAENHRTGYVALTRARRKTYLLLTRAGEEHSLWGHELWRNARREYHVNYEELAELLHPPRPDEPCPSCRNQGRRESLVLRTGPERDFVSCTSFRGLDAQRNSCGHREDPCEKCGQGIMVRDGNGNSHCHDHRCGWKAPLCGCNVAKPMKIRKKDGRKFYGCQDFGRASGYCRITRNINPDYVHPSPG